MTAHGRNRSAFDTVETAIEASQHGKMVLILDDTERENEGDLFVPAETVSTEDINFMITKGRGLVCVPMTAERLDELGLEAMVLPAENTEAMGTAFTISVDATTTQTGISAPDRADTIRTLIDSETAPEDLERPGHVFPLEAAEGGLLEREGHTEAAVDLARLAGLKPAGVICEVMVEDGTMAREPELLAFAAEYDVAIITVGSLIEYRWRNERALTRAVETTLPTEYGCFDLYAYDHDGDTHLALSNLDDTRDTGEVGDEWPLVRVHSRCLTGDALGSLRCDCGFQLQEALETIGHRGGVLLYLDQEGRDIGLLEKLKAYELQDGTYDTVEANEALGFKPDERRFDIAARMLRDLGVGQLTLLTNNPRKVADLEQFGLDVNRQPMDVARTEENAEYLATKREKLGHRFERSHP